MCGIAGLIWKGGVTSDIGSEMTQMLQALKHRGPDSTGFALYGKGEDGVHVLRFKVAEQEDMKTGFDIHRQVVERKATVDARLKELGAEVISIGVQPDGTNINAECGSTHPETLAAEVQHSQSCWAIDN